MKKELLMAFVLLPFLSMKTQAQHSPQTLITNSNWTATDALGRKLPDFEETGFTKTNRYVGLFYWLWHGNLRSSVNHPDSINVTKVLDKNPDKKDWRKEDYYWDEPELGYYKSLDKWVMRRHLQLMAAAGVDFIFLDLTNGDIYEEELHQLLQLIKAMRSLRIAAPYVVPFLNFQYGWKVETLYKTFYQNKSYDDVWFKWKGKPLMMSPLLTANDIKDAGLLSAIKNHFTWRPTWALFPDDEESKGKWRFMDYTPQRPAIDTSGKPEQFVVAKSTGAPIWDYKYHGSSSKSNYAPQLDKYWLAEETGAGNFFNEQWDIADSVAAPVLLVTGWNEFKAGAWPTNKELAAAKDFKFQGKKMKEGDLYFVDEFNREFNRDIEPIKNGYTDNFYYQFVNRMRRYKGMQAPEKASAPKSIKIDGSFDEWKSVTPVYTDFEGDNDHRNFDSVIPGLQYENATGRNDIVEARTTRDSRNVYFYIKTSATISDYTDKNWMLLFIDSDDNKSTGWEGYNYLINADVRSANKTFLKSWKNNKWKKAKIISYSLKGNEIEISVPLTALNLTVGNVKFNFHIADNIQKLNDISEFFVSGDSAPERRFDYHFEE